MDLHIEHQAKFALTQMLRRSLEILCLPQLELAALISEEIDRNPLLEPLSSGGSAELAPEMPAPPSLHEHLLAQIREALPVEEEIGEKILEHLDERGFLSESYEEIRICPARLEEIVQILQTFEPAGIFARNLQEAFLIQLERRREEKSLAFRIIQEAFDDFLLGRYGALKKKLRATALELRSAIQKILRLQPRPSDAFAISLTQPIYPDLQMIHTGSEWIVDSVDEALPKFRFKEEYLRLSALTQHQKQTVRAFATTARWLCRSIERRRKLLVSIGTYLVQKQAAFFDGEREVAAVSTKELALKFKVHESTISRAVANKYLASPFGLLPLKRLIASNESAKELLHRFIAQEDKKSPLTDDQLAAALRKKGKAVARRTIAKYRKQLQIKSASARKHIR